MEYKYSFDPTLAKEKIVTDIREWFDKNGSECNACVGISGGKDSTIVAALCVEALGKERVFGVMMPNGEQKDINDSIEVCQYLDINYATINIKDSYDSILKQISVDGYTKQTEYNLAPRLRMTALYAFSQSFNGRVVGTSNLSEYTIGWCTKWGDMAADYEPIINYTCTEVIEIGKTMDIPLHLIEKAPSDGLVGISDEEKFGFKYKELDDYIRTGICDESKISKMITMIENSRFKRKPIESSEAYTKLFNGCASLS